MSGWKKGDRVVTPDGPGKVVGPFLSRGLRGSGGLDPDGWIVATDNGKRRVYRDIDLEPEQEA